MNTDLTKVPLRSKSQVTFSSQININGEDHKLIECNSDISKQFAGITSIIIDLSVIQESIEKYLNNPSHGLEHCYSLIISYRRCWNDRGDRYFKLEEDHLKTAPKTLKDFHNLLWERANHPIAHTPGKKDDSKDLDYSKTYLLVNAHGEAIDAFPLKLTFQNLEPNLYRLWIELLIHLQNVLKDKKEKTKKALLKEYNSSPLKPS